jgi:stage III sporulation protein AF
MPTLQDIQRDAEALRQSQQASASALTEKKLAEAMRETIAKRTGLEVLEVNVKLEREAESAGVSAVTVTLGTADESGETGSPSSDGTNGTGGEGTAAPDQASRNAAGNPVGKPDSGEDQVKPVEPVAVMVNVQSEADQPPGAGDTTDDRFIPADRGKTDAVKQVLREGWAVDPGSVAVREAAGPGGQESGERRE